MAPPPTTVLVLSPSTGGPFFGEILSGLAHEVAAVDGRLVLVQTLGPGYRPDDAAEAREFTTRAAWAHIDGAVAITSAVRGTYLQALRHEGKPVVVASASIPGFAAPFALPDNHDGTVAAVEHLIAHGHTRIGFVTVPGHTDVAERQTAYHETLERHGLDGDPALVFTSPDNSASGGAAAAAAVLAAPRRPTALMVAADRAALGLLRALTDAGLVVPRDLAVISFDNIEAGAFSTPTLSSVNQRFDEVGALAGRLLLAQIRGEAVAAGAHISPVAGLALRASCGCGQATPSAPPDAAADTTDGVPGWLESGRDELSDLLRGALLTYDSTAGGPTEDAVLSLALEIESLLDSGSSVPAARLDALTASLRRIAPDPGMLHRAVGALNEYLLRTASEPSSTADGSTPPTARVAAALWQMQAGSFRGRSSSFENALDEQVAVDQGLLEAAGSHPGLLGWLAGTHVRAGVLGLWDGDPASGRLRIAGTYDPEGLLPGSAGASRAVERFPPAALIDAARPQDNSLCIVVPVRTSDRDWGLLAVVGTISTIGTRETYHHWAALLCTALESDLLRAAVRQSEERYALVARATNDGLWEWDPASKDLYLSDRCAALLGLPPGPPADRLAEWEAVVHPDDLPDMQQVLHVAAIGQRETAEAEYRVVAADGDHRWVMARALGVRSPDGSVGRVVGSLSDIDDRHVLEDKLRENALYDALTGLPNRRLFLDRLERALGLWRRSGTPFAVLFLDLDGFKLINDSLGHPAGDRLLRAVGARIQRELRTVDTGARFGGDEFAILLHDVPPGSVLQVAQRVQAAIAEPIDLDGHEFTVRASLGVATSAVGDDSGEDILRDADTAMYKAKATERGSVSFFDAEMHADAAQQRSLHAELRRALDEHQFEVRYEPVVNFATGAVDRFAAAVHWRHPERGLVPSAEFLPSLGEAGLAVALGHWVIDEVCRHLAGWGADVVRVTIAVSDRELWHRDLLAVVLAALERHGVTGDRLALQVEAGAITRRPDVAARILHGLHDTGARLHLDDLGTGPASLDTLHRFPLDVVTIDRSSLRGLTVDDRTGHLIGALVTMGEALGLAVAGRGAETLDQLELLAGLGCTTGQGPLLPAVAADDARAALTRILAARASTGLIQPGAGLIIEASRPM